MHAAADPRNAVGGSRVVLREARVAEEVTP
jgi:hypothetical protein